MSELLTKRLTRRELVRAAGITAAVAGASLAGPLGRSSVADATGDGTAEGFLSFAYAERERAATTGDQSILDGVYDASNANLVRFERERAAFLARGLGVAWNGTFLEHAPSLALVSVTKDGADVVARLYETLTSRWVPASRTPSAEELALQAEFPSKYIDTTQRGPRGEISSIAVIPHEVRLVRGTRGWRIAADQHDEFFLAGKSPDLVPGSWAAIREGKSTQVRTGTSLIEAPAHLKGPGLARPLQTQYVYDWNAAVWYARTYAYSPYPMYCNYDACNGDCTNFVSQCFRQGGQVDQSPWYTFNGACGTCGTTASYAGTDTWANVGLNYNFFMTNNNRAAPRSSISQVSTGDFIDYDWNNDGTWDHKTIISSPNGDYTLVCCHSPWLKDYIWTLDSSSAGHRFGWMNQYYTA